MKKKEFDEAVKFFKPYDNIRIIYRGNYGQMEDKGLIFQIKDGRISMNHGPSHHYTRILRMDMIVETKKCPECGKEMEYHDKECVTANGRVSPQPHWFCGDCDIEVFPNGNVRYGVPACVHALPRQCPGVDTFGQMG